MILRQGHAQQAYRGWRVIVHRDIKPENILLGDRLVRSNEYPLYPVPKLADYGLAYVVDPAVPATRQGGPGTPGFRAPEQEKHGYMPLSTQTNIYGVGITIMTLMNLKWKTSKRIEWDIGESPSFNKIGNQYSRELRLLVNQCLKFEPTDRIELDDLRARIEVHTTPGSGDLSDGYRNMSTEAAKKLRNGPFDLLLQPDPYRLGLSFAAPDEDVAGVPVEEGAEEGVAEGGVEGAGEPMETDGNDDDEHRTESDDEPMED